MKYTQVHTRSLPLPFFLLSSLVLVSMSAASCNGAPDSADSGGNDDDGTGAMGGLGGETGGGGAIKYPPFSEEPLYGEKGDAPDELRLRFQTIEIPSGRSGTDFAFLPGGRQILFTSRDNGLLHVSFQNGVASYLNSWEIAEEILIDDACGPSNILLDYDFSNTHFIYTSYCVDERVTRLMRYTWTPEKGPHDPAVIFETKLGEDQALDEWHRIGSMGWEDDGVLWFLVGDHFHEDRGQNFENPMGSVQRIIPNRETKGEGHKIPKGNMQIYMQGAGSGESVDSGLFAYGFRSPWRGTRDSQGRYWVGDVGLVDFEEVNLVTQVGQNFGWATFEGPCEDECELYENPVASYDRSEDHAYAAEDPEGEVSNKRAIWVGQAYEGSDYDRYEGMMDGVVPFGDLFTGWVRGLKANGKDKITMDENIGHLMYVTSWKVAPDGYAYALDLSGQLHVALLDFE